MSYRDFEKALSRARYVYVSMPFFYRGVGNNNLFLSETSAPHYLRPVSVVHHPDFPAPRYEVLYRIRRKGSGGYDVMTEWFSTKNEAIRFAREKHETSG
jgi:hypothetical protein